MEMGIEETTKKQRGRQGKLKPARKAGHQRI